MSIEVIQPYKPQPIQFSSPDDFNIYYNKHKEDFNDTTYKLNVKYKIPGFKITKIKGEMKLIKDYNAVHSSNAQSSTAAYADAEIKNLKQSIANLEERLHSIEQYLSSLNQ